MRAREESLTLRHDKMALEKQRLQLQEASVVRLKAFEQEIEQRAVNTDALEDELARVRPRLESLHAVEAQLVETREQLGAVEDLLAQTREAKEIADGRMVEMRRDMEECLVKMRRLEDRQAEMGLLTQEAAFLRGTLASRQVQNDELLRERTHLLLQVEDAQQAMFAATAELRSLQQRALSGTVTAALVEEVEALRTMAKDASAARDQAIDQVQKVQEELAALRARGMVARHKAAEHHALESSSTTWEERVKVLELDNVRLAQEVAELKAAGSHQAALADTGTVQRAVTAEREAEYKARIAALEAQLRVAQQHGLDTANSLQALLQDMWLLKNENRQLFADLCASVRLVFVCVCGVG